MRVLPKEGLMMVMDEAKIFAEQLLLKDKELAPVAIFVYEDYKVDVHDLDMPNKEKMRKTLQTMIIELKPQAVIVVSDAWMIEKNITDVNYEKDLERIQREGVEGEPQRKKCINLAIGSIYGISLRYRQYTRNEDGSITLGKESDISEDSESTCNFFGDVWDRVMDNHVAEA